jgi:hypothetical protein
VGGPPAPAERSAPAYDLDDVRQLVATGDFDVTARVRRHSRRKCWDPTFIAECLAMLGPGDFHKSQPHHSRYGAWLDIYRPVVDGRRRYIKFLVEEGRLIVLSFCDDGEAH